MPGLLSTSKLSDNLYKLFNKMEGIAKIEVVEEFETIVYGLRTNDNFDIEIKFLIFMI